MILNWVGKEEAIILANSDTDKVLLENSADSVNWNNTNNLFIEGDNIEVLKILKKDYSNKVNVIYIDPPYNTGNKFIYNDKFKHDNWLSMIYPRLILAKELLSDNGVIFISIDDNEQAQLKLLCDEVFGEDNFVSNILWINHKSPSCNTTGKKKINKTNEYVLMYAKNIKEVNINTRKLTKEELLERGYTKKDEYYEERGNYNLTPLSRKSTAGAFQYIKSLDYEIQAPDGTMFRNPANKVFSENARYTWGKDTFDKGKELGFIEIKKNSNGDWVAYRKIYEKCSFNPKTKQIEYVNQNEEYNNIIEISGATGTKDISKLFNSSKIFTFSKPVNLIKHLLKLATKPDSIVLDFFAGSGTTAQAVMELNKEDNGNRKFILVQLPENGIEEITKERIRRAGKVIKQELNNVDIGFKYYKI